MSLILTPVTLEEALAGLPDGRYLADDFEIFSGLRVKDGVVTDEVTFSENNFEGWLRQYGYDTEPQNLRIYRVEQKEPTNEPG